MKYTFFILLFAGTICLTLLQAQNKPASPPAPSHIMAREVYRDRQTFLIVSDGSVVFASGDWEGSSRLRKYAARQAGTYVVYASNADIYRIDDAAAVRALGPLIATVNDLADQQNKLSAQQEPLARQQADLSKKMKQAATPQEMTEIGSRQAEIGQQQAEIGREQGRVGNQQGIVGRQTYNEVQKIIDRCEQDKTCPAVLE